LQRKQGNHDTLLNELQPLNINNKAKITTIENNLLRHKEDCDTRFANTQPIILMVYGVC